MTFCWSQSSKLAKRQIIFDDFTDEERWLLKEELEQIFQDIKKKSHNTQYSTNYILRT